MNFTFDVDSTGRLAFRAPSAPSVKIAVSETKIRTGSAVPVLSAAIRTTSATSAVHDAAIKEDE